MPDPAFTAIGVDYRHERDFLIDRPHGSGDHVLLHFTTPVVVHTETGAVPAPAGACLVYAPPFRQWYHGDGVGLGNDWAHFAGRGTVALLRRLAIPVNRVLRPADAGFVAPLLREAEGEIHRADRGWREASSALLVQILVRLSRQLAASAVAPALSPRLRELRGRLQAIRQRMRSAPGAPWRVDALADAAHLSPSRFRALYRRFFGVSPAEDLIRARIRTARLLLTNATLTVGEVARRSGFGSVYYFSRAFKARVGCPPREYYRRHVAAD